MWPGSHLEVKKIMKKEFDKGNLLDKNGQNSLSNVPEN